MGFTSDEMRQFVDAVRGEPEGGECVVRGTVTRVDADGTAWVQIGQNAEPTPCQRDMACHVGDSVTVRIADHKATVTGNASAPATDDHAAKEAHGVAMAAQASAEVAQGEAQGAQQAAASAATTARNAAQTADAASTAAGEAKTIAEATGQHVWDDESGLHVTEVEREDYEQTPAGFARLMTSAGELLTRAVEGVEKLLRSDTASGTVYYDGECAPAAADAEDHVVAAFTKDGAQIGRKGNAHVEMDYNSFKMVDKDGLDFFVADDLRDENGVATITETFMGNGSTRSFYVQLTPTEVVSATDSSHEGAAYTASGKKVIFNVAPSDGAIVTIVYKTASGNAKSYTHGKRKAGSVIGPMSVAEGVDTTASGSTSHAEGYYTTASDSCSHAEGNGTFAIGNCSHAEGYSTTASDSYSHAEGYGTTASGGSHVEGTGAVASGSFSHAEGDRAKASGTNAHAEGWKTKASGNGSHAEGGETTASSLSSHAEGSSTTASGGSAHAEGGDTTASGAYSHAEGKSTIARGTYQHVEGRYNVADANSEYAHIIGNGTSDSNRSNAYTVDWNGNVEAEGYITAGGDVNAAGDVYGGRHIAKADVDSATSSLSANHYHRFAQVRDTNDVQYAFVEAAKYTDGRVRNGLIVHRVINGVEKYGSLAVIMDNDGNVSWTLNNPANFRSQLGLGNTTRALPIANGGTGATTASAAVQALTGRVWDFNTANTTDTWVPVATMVNGVATWRHRSIPANVQDGKLEHWSSGQFHAYKRSGIVTISYTSSGAEAYYNQVIKTLPAGYRPPTNMIGAAFAGGGANVEVRTDGAVIGYGPQGTAVYWRFTMTFPVA